MRRYRILVIGLVVAAVCVRLGFWQVSRLHQRLALRGLVEARERMTPLDLTGSTTGDGTDSLAYRHARVTGTFDFAHQVVVISRGVDDVPAVYVVTPLRGEGRALLVERGWTPSADAYTAELDSLAEPDTATVTGVLVPFEAARTAGPDSTAWPLHVRHDDPAALAARFPYPLFPLVLRRTQTDRRLPAALRLIPAPTIDNGPHLSYAIQWFSFAVIAIVGSSILFRREPREARRHT